MLRSKQQPKPQVFQEEVRQLSQISIQSNVGSKMRLHEDPSTQYESLLPSPPTQDFTKMAKHYSSEEGASQRFLRQRLPKKTSNSKDNREKSKNKRTSPNSFKPNEQPPRLLGTNRVDQMMEKMRELQRAGELRQQRFVTAVDEIRKDLQIKEARSQALRKDLEETKRQLVERKKDINQLIQMMKELSVHAEANIKMISRYPSEQSHETVKSDRDKPKKTSNEKPGKKVNSPGKKPGPQLKERSPTGRLIGKN